MKTIFDFLYSFTLSLWVGGMMIFTFIITPVIFKAHGRDMAGKIVGHLFPFYFLYNLCLSGIALFLVFLMGRTTKWASIIAMVLLITAVVINIVHIVFFLPKMEDLKTGIASFETTPKDHPLRQQFNRLHGISAILNLSLLVEGIALLVLHYFRKA